MREDPGRPSDTAVHFPWEQYRRRPKWFTHDGALGGLRATYPNVESASLWGHVAWVPKGQRAPGHSAPGTTQRIYLGLAGEVDFLMAGQKLRLAPLDVLVFADAPYTFENFGSEDALFWVLSWRSGPPSPQASARGTVYFDAEPDSDPTDSEKYAYLPWSDYSGQGEWQPSPDAPWGHQWAAHPWIELDSGVHGRMLRLSPGNSIGAYATTHDALLLGVVGEVEVSIGDQTLDLLARDAVVAPPKSELSLMNIGFEDALLFVFTPGP